MELTNLTVTQFAAATASGEPVPGGGSISALCGALAAALAEMVGHLTLGKKKYADVQEEAQRVVDKLNPIVNQLLEAVNLDSEAYDLVFQAYKLPKDTDEQKDARTAAIQEALKHAASVPLNVAQTVASILPEIKHIAVIGNQNAITDAYVATLTARTAILGACANTRINLTSINDKTFVDYATRNVIKLEADADKAEKTVRLLLNQALA